MAVCPGRTGGTLPSVSAGHRLFVDRAHDLVQGVPLGWKAAGAGAGPFSPGRSMAAESREQSDGHSPQAHQEDAMRAGAATLSMDIVFQRPPFHRSMTWATSMYRL